MSGGNAAEAAAPPTLIVAADVDLHGDLPRPAPAVPGARDLFPDEAARHLRRIGRHSGRDRFSVEGTQEQAVAGDGAGAVVQPGATPAQIEFARR